MPGGRKGQGSYEGPSDEDLAAFSEMLGGKLDDSTHIDLAEGFIGKLIERVTDKGYAMRIAPVDGGRARAVTIYLSGDRKVERRGSSAEALEEELRLLWLAAEKLPRKRT